MRQLGYKKWWLYGGLVAMTIGGVSCGALAHEPEAVEPREQIGSRLHFSGGFDFTNQYWFRGINQENQDLILQPWAKLEIEAFEYGDLRGTAVISFDNSLHRGPSGLAGPTTDFWYESDFYGGFRLNYKEYSVETAYMVRFAPGTGNRFSEEIDLTFAYNDAALWDGVSAEFGGLQPYVLLVLEGNPGSDGLGTGGNQGYYLELGINPALLVLDGEDYPVTLNVPVALGINLGDYYETASGIDNDKTFGFVDVGLELSIPLDALISQGFGQWRFTVGGHGIYIGDSPLEISSADLGMIPGNQDFSTYAIARFELLAQ